MQDYLLQIALPFKMNVPDASHGRFLGKANQTVRRVPDISDRNRGAIINARPLTTTNLSDSEAPEPLTPNHLLTAKAKVVLPRPGALQREDLYSRKWWR